MRSIWLYGHGSMGRLHAKKLEVRPEIKVSIIDPKFGFLEPQGHPDGVIIATPAKTHAEIAKRHLIFGRHCLVEKPLSHDIKTAQDLAAYPQLCMGFLERFCPVWNHMPHIKPRFIQAERISPFSGRGIDVDVILDLMIHDIDHCLRLMGEMPNEIRAIGIAARTESPDMVNARLAFSNGRVAQLSASRVSHKAKRDLRLFSDGDYLSIDLRQQTMHRIHWAANQTEPEQLTVVQKDPLTQMHDAFIDAMRDHSPYPIPPNDGLRAMEVAIAVREALC